MALIVEDGTGLEDANAYVDVDYVKEYARKHGLQFDGDDEVLEDAIEVATIYTDTRWGNSLRGRPLRSVQALEFPRLYLTDRYGRDIEGVPAGVQDACAEYAIIQKTNGTLYPTPPSNSPQQIKKTKTVVGPITTEKEFVGVVSQGAYLQHPRPDYNMRKYTRSANGVIR
ncbi:structural phage protein [Vibrio phage VpKK5]|uniref:head-tail adaptor Ad1 n=1 Tax=Vibrio phage VpKK5 TaxID=1538804 RepID=UPI0004F93334|nr:head-tail adaptor Ad1 [Vibrio phage VpKK5]AIM40555.1 structural phage protein [Vibrio phage VpKK5]